MHYKKLVGKKVYLSPVKIEDASVFTLWMNNSNITNNTGTTAKTYSLVTEEEWIMEIVKSSVPTFSILVKENDKLIGNCGLMDINHINRSATLGIMIGEEEYQNKGYGSEAIKLLIDYGFQVLNLHNIDLHVFSFNKKAINCYQKLGFKVYGERKESYYLNGKYYDEILMEIISPFDAISF